MSHRVGGQTPRPQPPVDPAAFCDPDRRRLAAAYARRMRLAHLLSIAGMLAYFAGWTFGGGPLALSQLAARVSPRWPLQVALAFLVVGAGAWVLDTLLAIPRYQWARAFGQNTQSWREWLVDRTKMGLIAGLLGLTAVEGLFAFQRSGRPEWWLWAGLAFVTVQALLTFVGPVVIAPLFFRFTPLEDPELQARFLRLAEEAGVPAVGVYRFDMSRRTRAANAAVVGLGRTRRIVIADTLLDSFSPDEAEGVLAHELAHHVHRDPYWGLLASGLVTLVGLRLLAEVWPAAAQGLGLPADAPGLLPVIGLFFQVYGHVTAPIMNLWSRGREALADIFAVAITGKGRAYARALARLADQNLIELWPPRWYTLLFATHPPVGERIELAVALDREVEASSTGSRRT